MTIPRRQQFDATRPPWLHCTSRCVRRAYLAGDQFEHRKDWIEERLQLMARCFAMEVAAFAVMSNHFHVVLRMRPDLVAEWDDVEIAKRWLSIYPRKYTADGSPILPDDEVIAQVAKQKVKITRWRKRLGDVGWCMKALKEPIARRANKEDNCTGTFWEGRYHSTVLLDQAALIACMAYNDLNPIRAKITDRPEAALHTSAYQRIQTRNQFQSARKIKNRKLRNKNSRNITQDAVKPKMLHHNEDGLWVTPLKNCIVGERLANKIITADEYITILDTTGRLLKEGKRGRIPPELAPILLRLDLSVEAWLATMYGWRMFAFASAIGNAAARSAEAAKRKITCIKNRCPLFTADPPSKSA